MDPQRATTAILNRKRRVPAEVRRWLIADSLHHFRKMSRDFSRCAWLAPKSNLFQPSISPAVFHVFNNAPVGASRRFEFLRQKKERHERDDAPSDTLNTSGRRI
jgi:hypothetical protein